MPHHLRLHGSCTRRAPHPRSCTATADAGSPRVEFGIYSAVVTRLCGPDDTGGGQIPKPVVYISGVTNDLAGGPDAREGTPTVIPPAVRDGVSDALKDLPSKVEWVDGPESVRRDPRTGGVWGGGVIIELGNIRRIDEDSVRVPGSIFIASLGAGGTVYLVEKVDGTWRITGGTGSRWVSWNRPRPNKRIDTDKPAG